MCFDWVNDREVWRSIIAMVFWYGTKRKTFLRAGRCFFWIWSTLVSAWTKTQSLIPVSCISSLVDSTLYTHCVFSLAVAGSCISFLCRGTSCLLSVICMLSLCFCLVFIWIVLFLSCMKLLMSDCGSLHGRQVAQTIFFSAAILFLRPGTCYRVFLACFPSWLWSLISDRTFKRASMSLAFCLSLTFYCPFIRVLF